MDLKSKTIIWIGAGLGTALVGYFAFDLLKTKSDQKKYSTSLDKNVGKQNSSLGIDDISSSGAQPSNDSYPFGVGSYGAKVFVLQEALNTLGASLVVDGKFGQKSYKAVNNVSFGFGAGNILCGINYGCKVSYDNWLNIVNKATEKGFNVNTAWTNAKIKWKI